MANNGTCFQKVSEQSNTNIQHTDFVYDIHWFNIHILFRHAIENWDLIDEEYESWVWIIC